MLVTAAGSGGGFSLTIGASDDLQPILELRSEHELRQLVMTVVPSPAFLRGINEFEHHRQRRRVREASPSRGSCGDARWRTCSRSCD